MSCIEELIEKYADTEVEFECYYKYTFTYKGLTKDGHLLVAEYGENSDDIYKHEVSAGVKETVSSLYPDTIRVYSGKDLIEEAYR